MTAARSYRLVLPILGLMALSVLPWGSAHAQSLAMQGGNITLTITTGIPGASLTPVIDAASKIRYRQAAVVTKMTVQTVCPGQKFGLTVEAISVGDGTPAPVVTLTNGMLPTDFITNIGAGSRKNFTTSLQYTASASFSQGNSTELGDDIHTVTYTLVAQ